MNLAVFGAVHVTSPDVDEIYIKASKASVLAGV